MGYEFTEQSESNLTKHDGYKSINSLQDSLNHTYKLKCILYDCN